MLTVTVTALFGSIPAEAQTAIRPNTDQAAATNFSEIRHPAEQGRFEVDTTDWDFSEPGVNKNNIDNHHLETVLPTDLGEPQSEITPGKMRSDRLTLPEGVTKAEADQAEVQEARELGIADGGGESFVQSMAADNCRSYWPSTNQVCGAIRAKYESMAITWAGQTPVSFLGLPISEELTNPDGIGKRTQFQNGFIYWHPDTGAWSITTHNSIAWQRNGWEAGHLGYPTSDEIGTPDLGRKQNFQNGRLYTSIYGTWAIEGKILEKWIETGEEAGPLGYPATDEVGTPDGIGRFNRFANGMIYWHPQYGAHPVRGDILDHWLHSGFEQSQYGYPTSDPTPASFSGTYQSFERDDMYLPGKDQVVSYACNRAVEDFVRNKPSLSDIRFACTESGIFVSSSNSSDTFLPKESYYQQSRTMNEETTSTRSQLGWQECDMYQPITISGNYEITKYIAHKSVQTCIGRINTKTQSADWSRLFNYKIGLNLRQRRHHEVTLTNLSTNISDGSFTASFRLRRSKFGRDETRDETQITVPAHGGASETNQVHVDDLRASYFLEHTYVSLEIPSMNYNFDMGSGSGGGLRIKLPKYSCPAVNPNEEIDLCTFD